MSNRTWSRVCGSLVAILSGAMLAWVWHGAMKGDPPIYHDRGSFAWPFLLVIGVGFSLVPRVIEENEALAAIPRDQLKVPSPARLIRSPIFWLCFLGVLMTAVNGVVMSQIRPH